MNICLFVDEFASGSTPKLITYPAMELKKLGHNVCVVILFRRNSISEKRLIKEFLLNNNIKFRFISDRIPKFILNRNFKFPFMDFFSLHHFLGLFYAHRAFKYKEFDYMISSCQYSFFSNINILVKRKIKHSLIVWDPSAWTAKKIFKKKLNPILYLIFKFFCFLLDYMSCKFATSLISSCRFHGKSFKKFNENIDYLYPCSNNFPKKIKRSNKILVFDRWDNGNNPLIYLDLIEKLRNEGKNFILIIGGIWHNKSMEKKFFVDVRKKKLSRYINYVGYLNDKQISHYAATSKYHINLVHEAFGMPSLEVAKNGCLPFIVKKSGVLDILKINKELIISDSEKIIEISRRIIYFENNKKLYLQISKDLIKNSKRYNWHQYALNLERIIKYRLI